MIEGGSRSQIVDSAIINSVLWSSVEILILQKNMRLQDPGLDDELQEELAKFSKWILAVGEGRVGISASVNSSDEMLIEIPEDLLQKPEGDNVPTIVNAVYSELQNQYTDVNYLQSRARLCPTNDSVYEINSYSLPTSWPRKTIFKL